jgi:GDP-mannose 6-dehydrogenase
MKVALFGLGYVGAVTAGGLAEKGHVVTGVDIEQAKVDTLNAGRGTVAEPGLDDLISRGVVSGRLRATTRAQEALDGADISLICVGTPSGTYGGANLTYLERCLDDIAEALTTGTPPSSGLHTIVVRSTVPPGTVDGLVADRAAAMSTSACDVTTAMCPEFLREGSGLSDFFGPSLVVVGSRDPRAAASVQELFGFVDVSVDVVDTTTAESLKYACNAFHATKVSFANEMGRVFRTMGVDSRDVMRLLCKDDVLNISPAYLRPGFAYGGSCLPKDLRALIDMSRRQSIDVPLLTGTAGTNDLVMREVVDRVLAAAPRSVALLGLSFKSNTDDLRESPSLEVAERLVGKGFDLRIYDPVVNPRRLIGANKRHVESRLPHVHRLLTSTPEQALVNVDLALVSTNDERARNALLANPPRRVIDLHGRLGDAVEAIPGYEGTGW